MHRARTHETLEVLHPGYNSADADQNIVMNTLVPADVDCLLQMDDNMNSDRCIPVGDWYYILDDDNLDRVDDIDCRLLQTHCYLDRVEDNSLDNRNEEGTDPDRVDILG